MTMNYDARKFTDLTKKPLRKINNRSYERRKSGWGGVIYVEALLSLECGHYAVMHKSAMPKNKARCHKCEDVS
jgi:hypothetical protein